MSQETQGLGPVAPAAPAALAAHPVPPADDIRETEVDGIRTVLAAGSGPVTAGLFFRVGVADETLATTGITHLVEHLALHRHGLSDLHYNGATAATYTLFHATGTPEEVVTYLNGVCAALRDLPLERLETEREILRTEAAGRNRGPNHQLPLWRYGAQGYGLSSYAEHGTWHLTADAVRDWARTRFTRDNAVLWITTASVPEGLDLTLPAGTPHPLPAPTSALPVTPAYITGNDGGVVLDGIVRRSTAASLFAEVLSRALYTDLRQKGGYSYVADADYSPRDNDFASITAFADALPKKQDAVVGGFVDALARLRAGTIEQTELDSARAKFLKQYDTPDLGAARLPSYALNLLTGHRNLTPDEHRAELAAVTLDDLREVARELHSTALLQVPGRGADWAGFTAAPQWSTDTPTASGTRHPGLEDSSTSLTVAPDAVSLTTPSGQVVIRYADCAALLVHPDGGRHLTGLDGFQIRVEPTLYKGLTPARTAVIDAAVPPAAVIRMPPRDPDRIPRPDSGSGTRPATATAGRVRTAFVWLAGTATVLWGLIALVATAQELDTRSPDPVTIIVLWALLAAPLGAFFGLRRGRRG
ncbi:pitrilysin family protein [Streptomyces sp. B1I3]|uniref:M16 family metallopeptidase n=1 Tax=Streptomyces sp. B1I3 TaxID=3042264 RepID=UPI002788F19A|nr:insulinase family protein [Streptomyces sp. B1I3]MDQ0794511.1 putative Zn-dependent peptidase [Streptomyces sp. B1I3]